MKPKIILIPKSTKVNTKITSPEAGIITTVSLIALSALSGFIMSGSGVGIIGIGLWIAISKIDKNLSWNSKTYLQISRQLLSRKLRGIDSEIRTTKYSRPGSFYYKQLCKQRIKILKRIELIDLNLFFIK